MQSWKNLVESTDNPIIVRGGPSSSDTLNRMNKNIQEDLINLSSKIDEMDRKQKLTSVYLSQQAAGIQTLSGYLQTIIPSAPANRAVADFFSSEYIHANNTCNIDYVYGQATLPILSTQEKLHSVDNYGNIWIPNDTRIKFYLSNTYSSNVIPSDDSFISSVEDHYGIGDQPDTFFLGGQTPSQTYLYLKINVPQTLNIHKLCNRLSFYPLPCFGSNLVNAYYKKTDGTWNAIDITYLLGYDSGTQMVSHLGPTRLHFTPSEVEEVCIVLQVNGWWGVQNLGLQLVEYDVSSNLTVDISSFGLTSISTVLLGGKDTTILNSYNTTISGNVITTNITQTTSYSSPIITYVDARA